MLKSFIGPLRNIFHQHVCIDHAIFMAKLLTNWWEKGLEVSIIVEFLYYLAFNLDSYGVALGSCHLL